MTTFTKSIVLLFSVTSLVTLQPVCTHGQTVIYPANDIRSIAPDVVIPPMVHALPAPGTRVRETHPDYRGTDVYHATYLPTDWKPGGRQVEARWKLDGSQMEAGWKPNEIGIKPRQNLEGSWMKACGNQ